LKSPNSTNLIVGVVGTVFILSSFFGCSDTSEPERSVPSSSVTETPEPSVTESVAPEPTPSGSTSPEPTSSATSPALTALATIPIKGRAPKTGYDRDLFASDWDYSFGCDMRNKILRRDFVEFQGTSNEVQIDHVVAVSDAWQKGAQQLSSAQRYAFYNDPLNLLAVSGSANAQKSDSDAASWLPSNKAYRCAYVARQVAVKISYNLWVTQAEYDAINRVLRDCPDQALPTG